ncbi:MAG: glycosyltransferase [Spirochaetes bacterium]|nr:glycosyltransferase [Spirochaetota bacterium]MBU0954872.1 glycosyltransferase [Spirochaetota bacterium]
MGKRLMILSASAGSGHVRAAQAVEEAARKDERISEVLHIDTLEYTNMMFQRIYSKGYLEAVKTIPDLWAMAFDNMDKPWEKTLVMSALQRMNSQPLVNKIKEYKPDICICTHFMPADIVSGMIKQDQLMCNLGIVVTDYYVHALWLTDLFTRYFVPKEESRRHLTLLGLPPDRIVVSGIPIMEAFSARQSKKALYAKFDLDPALPVVLLSAGAFGIMNAADILMILNQIHSKCQIVVICGKNVKLLRELGKAVEADQEAVAAAGKAARNRYSIIGYTDVMHEYLKIADVFISKPGGLSTSESMAAGVPMIIWDPIPGQELYNAYHLLENGVGMLPDNAITIGYKVDEILGNPERLKQMREKALSIAFPQASQTIVSAMLANEGETPVKPFKRLVQ